MAAGTRVPKGSPRSLEGVSFHVHVPTAPAWQGFTMSALAPAIAVCLTNPFDVAKVRLQKQGEAGSQRLYKGTFDCLKQLMRSEGLAGIERGLSVAILRESSKNFFRIGLFQPTLKMLHNPEDGPAPIYKRMIAGLVSGSAGAFACNPFELAKTQMQLATTGGNASNMTLRGAFGNIVRENGVMGVFRSAHVNMMRSMIGTPVNLTSYSLLKEAAHKRGFADATSTDLMCAFVSAGATTVAMNPVDMLRTRLYSQPRDASGRGTLYSGFGDAFTKVLRNEGPGAFFKGMVGAFLRLGPHFCLTFVILEQMRRLSRTHREQAAERTMSDQAFDFFDFDSSGSVDFEELLQAAKAICHPHIDAHIPDSVYEAELERDVGIFMKKHDVDDSGCLDRNEFFQAIHSLRIMLHRFEVKTLFKEIDTDNSGSIDATELAAALREGKILTPRAAAHGSVCHHTTNYHNNLMARMQANITMLMDFADANNDGLIDLDEFDTLIHKLDDEERGDIMAAWARAAGIGTD